MPTVDGYDKVKHITTHTTSAEMLTLWKEFPGVRAIVLHKRGKRAERPHYHIWWETDDAVKNEQVKESLRSYAPAFAKPFSDWKFTRGNEGKEHYVKWASYVSDATKGAEILFEQDPDELHPPIPNLPVLPATAGSGSVAATPVVVRRPSESQKARFVKHLLNLGWRVDDVTPENLSVKFFKLCDILTEWSENGFTTFQGVVTVQHALWYFADDGAQKEINEKNKVALSRASRLFS